MPPSGNSLAVPVRRSGQLLQLISQVLGSADAVHGVENAGGETLAVVQHIGGNADEGATLTAVLKAVATHHPPPPREVNPAVPAALSDLVMRLLEKDPARRPPSAAGVAAELQALERGEPAGPSGGRWSWPRPRRVAAPHTRGHPVGAG